MHPIETPDKTFHDGDGVSELGTILPAWWLNQIQAELLAVLTAGGIQPDKAKPNQVVEALRKIIDEQAATLAAGLQNKSDNGHTHRAAEIADLSDTIEAVVGRLFASKKSASGYLKIPGGLIIQWGDVEVDNDVFATVIFPVSFPTACLNVQVSAVWGNVAGGINVLSSHVGKISQTGCSVTVSENGIFGRRIVNWLAIGY